MNPVPFFWRWLVVHAWTSGPYAGRWPACPDPGPLFLYGLFRKDYRSLSNESNWSLLDYQHSGLCRYEPRHKKTCLRGLRPGMTKTGLLSYRGLLGLEISAIARRGIILSRQRKPKALIRLRGCVGWSAPLLFAYGINRFSHGAAQLFFPNQAPYHKKMILANRCKMH